MYDLTLHRVSWEIALDPAARVKDKALLRPVVLRTQLPVATGLI